MKLSLSDYRIWCALVETCDCSPEVGYDVFTDERDHFTFHAFQGGYRTALARQTQPTPKQIEAIETSLTLMRQQVLEGWDNGHTVDALQGLLDRDVLDQQEQPETITVTKEDYKAIKIAHYVVANIATGGEMFIDSRKDYITAASGTSSLLHRISAALLADPNDSQ